GRFTFGAPRDLRVSADGTRIAFLRSGSGTDPANRLWCLEVGSEDELLIADPGELLAEDEAAGLTPEERDRRERAREGAGGIVAYQTLPTLERAAFALAGQLFVADLVAARVTRPEAAHGVFDPRLAPEPSEGDRVAYVAGRTLRLTDPSGDRLLASDDSST